MLTKDEANFSKDTIEYKAALYRLEFAKQKLLAPEVPHRLRIISYLRIVCSVMQKIDRQESNGWRGKVDGTPYLSLLKSLSEHDVDWWKKCKITNNRELKSDDLTVNQLLNPLNTFINSQLEPFAA